MRKVPGLPPTGVDSASPIFRQEARDCKCTVVQREVAPLLPDVNTALSRCLYPTHWQVGCFSWDATHPETLPPGPRILQVTI